MMPISTVISLRNGEACPVRTPGPFRIRARTGSRTSYFDLQTLLGWITVHTIERPSRDKLERPASTLFPFSIRQTANSCSISLSSASARPYQRSSYRIQAPCVVAWPRRASNWPASMWQPRIRNTRPPADAEALAHQKRFLSSTLRLPRTHCSVSESCSPIPPLFPPAAKPHRLKRLSLLISSRSTSSLSYTSILAPWLIFISQSFFPRHRA